MLNELNSFKDAGSVALNILLNLKSPIKFEGREIFASVSIGISITPDDALDKDQLINNADLALYQVKENGRGYYQFFSSEMNEKIQGSYLPIDVQTGS